HREDPLAQGVRGPGGRGGACRPRRLRRRRLVCALDRGVATAVEYRRPRRGRRSPAPGPVPDRASPPAPVPGRGRAPGRGGIGGPALPVQAVGEVPAHFPVPPPAGPRGRCPALGRSPSKRVPPYVRKQPRPPAALA